MITRTATIASAAGLHARPASEFVNAAKAQRTAVTIARADSPERAVNAASILGVMGLNVKFGEQVVLNADGGAAAAALDALVGVLETDLDA